MTFMIEVYLNSPPDLRCETAISERVGQFGGRLVFQETPDADNTWAECLTYEFSGMTRAEQAATSLRQSSEHVEGPYPYY